MLHVAVAAVVAAVARAVAVAVVVAAVEVVAVFLPFICHCM